MEYREGWLALNQVYKINKQTTNSISGGSVIEFLAYETFPKWFLEEICEFWEPDEPLHSVR